MRHEYGVRIATSVTEYEQHVNQRSRVRCTSGTYDTAPYPFLTWAECRLYWKAFGEDHGFIPDNA